MMSEKALSPVIGVILMVAITVILAAVIAAFVIGAAQATPEQLPEPYTHKGYVMDLYQFEGVHYVDIQEGGEITIYQVRDTVLAYHLREGQTILFTVAPKWNVPPYPVIDSVRPWI